MVNSKIHLSNLSVPCIIGTLPWEQTIQQTLVIDLSYQFEVEPLAESDDLNDTVDYSKVVNAIHCFATENHIQLLETFTVRLANELQRQFDLAWLYIQVKKPGAIEKADYVAASIELVKAPL